MRISQQRLAYLLEVYTSGKASEDEINELLDWAHDSEDPAEPMPAVDWEALFQRVQQEKENARPLPAERLPIRRISWISAVAAASVLFAISAIFFYKYSNSNSRSTVAAKPKPVPKTDIKPGADGAILTLANGQQIVLDSAGNGTLATQGNTSLHNEHGQLSYNSNGTQLDKGQGDAGSGEVLYNTITTTRGKQYQLQLADGSRVWLNASSSIKFSTAFNGNDRSVAVSGEAYFEISPDPSRPFKVKLNDGEEIQVLGTHFNVNAYDDEALTRTTLLEGSVKVIAPAAKSQSRNTQSQSRILQPGDQARVSHTGEASIEITPNTDLDETIAWKEGLFLMKKADVSYIMRQIARWYDVEVVYKGGVPAGRISGDIPRNMSLSKVLEVMELSGVHFTVEGKKVIVSP
jgi:transmembrane sensor